MELNLLFSLANLYVIPLWMIMIFLPQWGLTQR
ncbi:MAG: ABA4-like family protein, partial [Geminocystis sp.]|nr:ABA4-like family protein [Geminocystis sp.]MCS7148453.1 ABA4-like family protein [Geminocystis sp.]